MFDYKTTGCTAGTGVQGHKFTKLINSINKLNLSLELEFTHHKIYTKVKPV